MSLLRGRFDGSLEPTMRRFSSSLDVDMRMLDEDIEGSVAHATMLAEQGLIDADEAQLIVEGLGRVHEELRSGRHVPADDCEDIHMAVEARLIEIIGTVGGKLHTGRSRNDQVATDVRLWLRRRMSEIDAAIAALMGALLDRVESDGRTLMPGYTHLQRGQPILLGHHLLAHAWHLERDRRRFRDARARADRCPLGSAALAGSPLPLDRRRTSDLLGFAAPAENAMDAVAARDHLQEAGAVAAICMSGLSRIAEELVLWSSTEFGFVRLSSGFATGSSIMPQKRNPDAAELVRGKAGRVAGDLVALLTLVKGLPLAYNRDLQEDREPLFDAIETTRSSLEILAGALRSLEFVGDRFESELAGDFSLATELADLLASRGVPFREAHDAVARLVRSLEAGGLSLSDLTPEMAAEAHPRLTGDLGEWVEPRAAAERRRTLGGSAWSEIERQVALLRRALSG